MSASPAPFIEFEGPLFRDRREAGERLARTLAVHRIEDGLVVGLARGGVEVAAEVAARLGLPLDALAVRKVGHPWHPEYAVGAVTPGGGEFVRAKESLPEEELRAAVAAAMEKAEELDRVLHADRPPLDPAARTVLLVDDGLATGATMTAAARWARAAGAARIVVAVPVGAPETVAALEQEADEVICLEQPELFGAVGLWYERFSQVSDERVLALLDTADPAPRPPGPNDVLARVT